MNTSIMNTSLSANIHHKINASQIHYFASLKTVPIHNFVNNRNALSQNRKINAGSKMFYDRNSRINSITMKS